jgi:hypothetical protein
MLLAQHQTTTATKHFGRRDGATVAAKETKATQVREQSSQLHFV